MVLLTMSLSAICSSMSILVYDTGTYDAGIVASVHAVATADRDSYTTIVSVLLQELLVVALLPSRQ